MRDRFFRWLHAAEDGLISLVFLVMTATPILEIVLRKARGQGITGSASIVQHLTLWAAFLGAMLATREQRHLSLSTAELLREGTPRKVARLFTSATSAAVTATLTVAGVKLLDAEMQSEKVIIGNIPHWWSEVIIPVALALITARIILSAHERWWGRVIAAATALGAFAVTAYASDPESLVWPLSIILGVALLAGAPIFVGMSGMALILFYGAETPIAAVPTETLRLAFSPILPAIPLLTVAGFILSEGGAAARLVRLSRALLGWLPGGTAIMVCVVCALFTTFTGGSGVTILALGGLMLPILVEERYPESFSYGLITASGSLGLLFFPSFPVILYSVAGQIPDMNALFIAGLLPGVLMILLVCIAGAVVGVRSGTPRTPFRAGEAGRALWDAKWELALPVVVAAAFLSGWATLVEAAALGLAHAAIVEVFVFKDIPLSKLPSTVTRGAALVGAVLVVLGFALGLTSYFVEAEIPDLVIQWVQAHVETQVGFLIVLNLILLPLGSIFEIYSAIVILAPLVAPLGVAYGVHPIHLAVVFLANLELGFLLPPVGLNLFLSSTRFERPLPKLYRDAMPFLGIMIVAVLLITYLPAITIGVVEWIDPAALTGPGIEP